MQNNFECLHRLKFCNLLYFIKQITALHTDHHNQILSTFTFMRLRHSTKSTGLQRSVLQYQRNRKSNCFVTGSVIVSGKCDSCIAIGTDEPCERGKQMAEAVCLDADSACYIVGVIPISIFQG
jgi:hypothetical protein